MGSRMAECAAANTTESHVNELMTNTAIDFRREASMAYPDPSLAALLPLPIAPAWLQDPL